MKKWKIRDKGTFSDSIDHEFTVISLKDQSRAKINMLLKIVNEMIRWLPLAVTLAFTFAAFFLEQNIAFQNSSQYQHILVYAWSTSFIVSIVIFIVYASRHGVNMFIRKEYKVAIPEGSGSAIHALSLFKVNGDTKVTVNGISKDEQEAIKSLENNLEKYKETALSDPSIIPKLVIRFAALSRLYLEQGNSEKYEYYKDETSCIINNDLYPRTREAKLAKKLLRHM
jgi:hypothetical protein